MAHADYLRQLLAPLGVYDLSPATLNGSELAAIGAGLDAVENALTRLELEGCLATAQEEGLSRLDALFLHPPIHHSLTDHRNALAALMRIGQSPPSSSALNSAIHGCGIPALVKETDTYGQLQVEFPATIGIPENFVEIRQMILDLLPCHLEASFYFRYLLWSECDALGFTWEQLANLSWQEWQESVPNA